MRALFVVALAACWTNGPESHVTTSEPVHSHPMPARSHDPVTLDLVEGLESTLPDGTIVGVKGVMYAHLANSKNLSSATLLVTHGGTTLELPLSRVHGDPNVAPQARVGHGWTFTLESADPYQQPSRVRVIAHQ